MEYLTPNVTQQKHVDIITGYTVPRNKTMLAFKPNVQTILPPRLSPSPHPDSSHVRSDWQGGQVTPDAIKKHGYSSPTDSRFTPSQWETGLLCKSITQYIKGLVQDCSNFSALAMEFPKSCTKPSLCWGQTSTALTSCLSRVELWQKQTVTWWKRNCEPWHIYVTCYKPDNISFYITMDSMKQCSPVI